MDVKPLPVLDEDASLLDAIETIRVADLGALLVPDEDASKGYRIKTATSILELLIEESNLPGKPAPAKKSLREVPDAQKVLRLDRFDGVAGNWNPKSAAWIEAANQHFERHELVVGIVTPTLVEIIAQDQEILVPYLGRPTICKCDLNHFHKPGSHKPSCYCGREINCF